MPMASDPTKGPAMNHALVIGADPSPLAALIDLFMAGP
jgi:hypothetical protein